MLNLPTKRGNVTEKIAKKRIGCKSKITVGRQNFTNQAVCGNEA